MIYSFKTICNIVLIFLLSCNSNRQTEIEIIPIDFLDFSSIFYNNGDTINHRVDYFIIKNYIEGDSSDIILDSFTCHKLDSAFALLDSYHITFFRHSEKTNLEEIGRNNRVIDRYSHLYDHIVTYMWTKKHRSILSKFKKIQEEGIRSIKCDE